jgi:hypothetical protein
MLVRTLFTQMPKVEKFAAREVAKGKQGTAVELALTLVKLRDAWDAVNKVRTGLIQGYDMTEDGGLSAQDGHDFTVTWDEALDREAEIVVEPIHELLEMTKEFASPAEIAALVTLGLYVPAGAEE